MCYLNCGGFYMIHSLAGGVIKTNEPVDFAKVKLEKKEQIAWYLCSHLPQLKQGDKVLVPYNEKLIEAVVLRVDKGISPQVTPIPIKRAKCIHSII